MRAHLHLERSKASEADVICTLKRVKQARWRLTAHENVSNRPLTSEVKKVKEIMIPTLRPPAHDPAHYSGAYDMPLDPGS